MVGKIQDSTSPNLKFSPSKLYFQHQNQLLQKIGFISPMTIDIHFKYTFQEIGVDYFIEGGEFEGLTVDHEVHEQGIIYKIGFLNNKYDNVEHISLDLNKNFLDNSSNFPLFLGLFGWVIVFGLLMWLYTKGQIWQILFWLNIVGGGILLFFYGWKIFKFLCKKFKAKKVEYGGFSVSYANHSDALMLSPKIIESLKVLGKEFWIVKFCYTGNCIYLLQDLHDHDGNRLSSSSKLYSEQEKAVLQQKTMDFIRQPEFLFNFMKN